MVVLVGYLLACNKPLFFSFLLNCFNDLILHPARTSSFLTFLSAPLFFFSFKLLFYSCRLMMMLFFFLLLSLLLRRCLFHFHLFFTVFFSLHADRLAMLCSTLWTYVTEMASNVLLLYTVADQITWTIAILSTFNFNFTFT